MAGNYSLRQEIRTRCQDLNMKKCLDRYTHIYGENSPKSAAYKSKTKTFERFLSGIAISEDLYLELCPLINLMQGWDLRYGDFCEEKQIEQLDRLRRIDEASIAAKRLRANEDHRESCIGLKRDFSAISAALQQHPMTNEVFPSKSQTGVAPNVSAQSNHTSSALDVQPASSTTTPSQTLADEDLTPNPSKGVRALNLKWLWLAAGLASFVLLALVASNIVAYFSKPQGHVSDPTFLIEVAQDGNPSVPLSEARLPLMAGDHLHISASTAEPLYYYIFCLDPAGRVVPKSPWIDDEWQSRSPQFDRPRTSLELPAAESSTKQGVFVLTKDDAGLHAIVLIARRSPLESDSELQKALKGFNPKAAAMPLYSNITVEIDRNGIKRNHQRVPLGDTIIQIDKNPLSQLQAFIKERVAQHGDAAMAICYSFGSSRDEE